MSFQSSRRMQPFKKENKKIDLTSEMNFPSLTGDSWSSQPKVNCGAGAVSFAELATDWKKSDDNSKKVTVVEKEVRTICPRIRLYTSRSRVEDTYEEEPEEEAPSYREASDWTTIEKKVKSYGSNNVEVWADCSGASVWEEPEPEEEELEEEEDY